MESSSQKYLVHFRKHLTHIDFCFQELEALASMNGVSKETLYAEDISKKDLLVNPTVWVYLPSQEVVEEIVSRAILIKEIIDVFSQFRIDNMDTPCLDEGKMPYDYQPLVDNVDKNKLHPLLA